MIALVCATLLCLVGVVGESDTSTGCTACFDNEPPQGRPPNSRSEPLRLLPESSWAFTAYIHGRPIVTGGWESERACREMREQKQRQYPYAVMTDCEERR